MAGLLLNNIFIYFNFDNNSRYEKLHVIVGHPVHCLVLTNLVCLVAANTKGSTKNKIKK